MNKQKVTDRRIEKLAALLKQAQDVAGTPEELAFREKFASLTAKWGIESERVLRYLQDEDPLAGTEGADSREINVTGKYVSLQMVLLGSIASVLHSIAVQEGHYRARLIGMPDHLDRIEVLFSACSADMIDSAMREGQEWKGQLTPGRLHVWRKSYAFGYITRICQLLDQAEKAAAVEAGALVLYKTDAERAQEKVVELYGDIRHQEHGSDIDPIAYHLGTSRADQSGIVG